MTAPRLSVVIPCYELGAYLDEAVQSVLAQTFQDTEIVVVDDGSQDAATRALLDHYAPPRTRVLREPHRGASAARNRGIAAARGELLCALDADDVLDPTYFAKAVALLDADPGLSFVSCWLRTFGAEEWEWRRERCDLVTLLGEDTVVGPAVVRRREVLAAGVYDESLGELGDEDWDLWLGIVERGGRGTILPEVLLRYRRRPGSLSTVCLTPETHLRLVRYLAEKHAPAYRAHLVEVLLDKQEQIAALVRANDEAEADLQGRLLPEIARRRAEVEALRGRLAAARAKEREAAELAELRERLRRLEESAAEVSGRWRRAEAAVEALRGSASWRVTAPLRAAHRWVGRWRR